MPTHPRVCGEHPSTPIDDDLPFDSPPRVRGAPSEAMAAYRADRLTPACAGSTLPQRRSRSASVDSPPRVRGAQRRRLHQRRKNRLTPACAGSTTCRHSHSSAPPTHPRVCGEHVLVPKVVDRVVDSPPRVRGARARAKSRGSRRRLTPACAGSTLFAASHASTVTTHPRVCGEHPVRRVARVDGDDSPPRVRGAPCSPRRTRRR